MKLLKAVALITTATFIGCSPTSKKAAQLQDSEGQTTYTVDTQQNNDTTLLSDSEDAAQSEKETALEKLRAQEGLVSEEGNKRIFKRVVSLDFECDTLITEYPPGCLQEVPENIVEYLENRGIAAYYDYNEYNFSKSNLIELQKYKEGKRKFYPTKEVTEAINSLAHDIDRSYHYNDLICTDTLQNLLYELTDIAVNLTPDINLISNCCSNDHRIGFIDNFGSYTEGYFCYSIIYKVADGKYKAYTIDIVDRAAPLTTIRKISEEKGKTSYIISAEGLYCSTRAYYTPFALYVIELFDNGTVKSHKPMNSNSVIEEWLSAYKSLPDYDYYIDTRVVYNPNNLSWEICNKDKNVYKKINGTKTLKLEFPNGTPTLTLN